MGQKARWVQPSVVVGRRRVWTACSVHGIRGRYSCSVYTARRLCAMSNVVVYLAVLCLLPTKEMVDAVECGEGVSCAGIANCRLVHGRRQCQSRAVLFSKQLDTDRMRVVQEEYKSARVEGRG